MATIPYSQPLTQTTDTRTGTTPLPAGPNPAPWSGPPGGILSLLNQYMPDVQQQGLLGMMARGQSLYTPVRGGGNVNALTQGNLYTAPNVPAFPSTTPTTPGTGGTGGTGGGTGGTHGRGGLGGAPGGAYMPGLMAPTPQVGSRNRLGQVWNGTSWA